MKRSYIVAILFSALAITLGACSDPTVDSLNSALSEDIDRMKLETAENHVRAIESALNLYRLDNFSYPTQAQGLHALVQRPSLRPEPRNYRQESYMRDMPKDPWGLDYRYRNPGNNGEIDVWTLTPDGEYIGNWNLSKR